VSESFDLFEYIMLVDQRDDARDDIIQGFGLGVVVGVLDGYVAIQGFAPACIVMGAVTLGTSCVVYIATVGGGAIATGYEIYRGIHGITEFNRLTDALPEHFFDIPHEEPY